MKNTVAGKDSAWVWGVHSLEAILESQPEIILELYLEKDSPAAERLGEQIDALGLKISGASIPKLLDDKRTQGVAARLRYFPTILWKSFLPTLSEALDAGASQWVLLDEIQDPRNFGAIVRSAAAFGVKGIFVASKNQAPVTGVVAQASAGTVFKIPIIVASNLRQVMEYFVEAKVPTCGLQMDGQSVDSFFELKKPQHLLWVLGSEGEGLSPKVSELCTVSLGIPMDNGVESLNVSAAASVVFYLGKSYLANCL